MKLDSLDKLLTDELKDLHSAETQLLKAIPKLAEAATCEALKEAFLAHLEETKGQVERLAKIADILQIKLTGKKCKAMEGLIKEGAEILKAEGSPEVLDAALIGAAQRVEHYEIAAYGTARAYADHLGHDEVVQLLTETLEEESSADEKLTTLSMDEILPSTDPAPAMQQKEESETEGMEMEEEAVAQQEE